MTLRLPAPAIAATLLLLPTGAFAQWGQSPKSQAGPPSTLAALQPDATSTLPNGASSIEETYGDWTVSCSMANGQKGCAFSQAQGNKQTGQRAFAIELRPPLDGAAAGTILMPLGLNLDAGAILKLDGTDLGKGVRFSTCLAQGCLIPISLPTVATDAMRKGKELTVAGLNNAKGDPATFNVSLNGFGPAMDRATQLAR